MRGTGSRRMAAAVDRLRENVGTGKRKRSASGAENGESQQETPAEDAQEQEEGEPGAAETSKRGKGRRTRAS